MARFFNEDHEKVFVLAPQIDDDEENFLARYNTELIEIFSSHNNNQQEQPLEIAAYSNIITSTDHNSQSAGLNEYYYKGVRRIIAGHIQFHSEAQAERAYALFNDTAIIVTKNSTTPNIRRIRIRLELLYYDQTPVDDNNININNNNGNNELLPALLHIRGIPSTIHNWFQETYDTFREQGRLLKCQRRHRCAIHQSNMQKSSQYCSDKHDPTVIVQYMSKVESDKAVIKLNGSILFDTCTLSIIVKTAPPAYPPEKSSDQSKRGTFYTKIKTGGYVRLSHGSLASPSSGSSSSSTAFQQRSSQQRYHHQGAQQDPIIIDENPPTTPTAISSTAASISPTKSASNNNKPQQLELKPAMDLCNIYIKHIDPSIKSTELFNLFKPFGRIISARVMEDPSTGNSRGFGFVSYSHPIEAAAALLEMNGYTGPNSDEVESPIILSASGNNNDNEKKLTGATNQWIGEPMSVRFHEPRIPRPERDHQQQVLKLFQSHLSAHFSFDHVLPAVTPDTIAGDNSDVNSTGGVAGGIVHHGNTMGSAGHYHHHPPPPPLMMPPPSGPHNQQHSPTTYYSPYSPSPTQPSQPLSPFTLQHPHSYIFSPTHSPYVIPHSPGTTGTNSTYYYYYPQQQAHMVPEYFTTGPLPPPQQQQQMMHHQQFQQSSYAQRPYTPTRYQQQSSSPPPSLQKTKKVTDVEQQQQAKTITEDEKHNNELVSSNNADIVSDHRNVNTTTNNKEEIVETDGGRQRLLEAVRQKLPQNENDSKINTVVDKLMETLNRKECSTCLFNEDYLEHHIKQILES